MNDSHIQYPFHILAHNDDISRSEAIGWTDLLALFFNTQRPFAPLEIYNKT
jgi:hypothetical protein